MAGLLSILNLKKKVVDFNNDLENYSIIKNIIDNNRHYIVDMNAEDQLFGEGINRCGVSIMDYMPYRPLTIEIKTAKGQPTDRVTLRDEGDFHESMFIEIGDKGFEIKASDFKTEHLIAKYGRQILGLTDENLKKLIWEYIYPDLLEIAKNKIL